MSKLAACPLDDFSLPTGGVILKSSDGIEFKVYKNILALASPFFCQMFTLPQPIDRSSAEELADGKNDKATRDVQVIDVPESSTALDILLRTIYPITPPPFPGVSNSGEVTDAQALVSGIEPVLAAALKYDMQLIVKELCKKLLGAADAALPDGNVVDDTLALRVFVLACRHGLKEEARRAAHSSLKGRVAGVFIEDLRNISAAQYFHLILFHQKIVTRVDSIFRSAQPPHPHPARCPSCRNDLWSDLVSRAHLILQQSPTCGRVYLPSFVGSVQTTDSCCQQRVNLAIQHIKESIEKAIVENDIDVSEI